MKSSMAVEVEVFEKEALAVSLAKYVPDLSNKFTQQRGAFTVCLSGGSLINYLRKLLEPSSNHFGDFGSGLWINWKAHHLIRPSKAIQRTIRRRYPQS
ncbi:hypothetical protein KIW84_063679 [Lathyrus oleraceus]|uniref:Glucosamine/galactosamine-6-phosphate isomerase domain-containing protein n=1 Tax=Pisum sativum TaxID=3888 RepID=A0A9D5A815_PEA|nr:hypothetical protein KIW84_063679 [Pisum sativum]